MHPVQVVLGDDLVAEELEQLDDLVVVEVLRQAEHELVTANTLVGLELLGDLLGVADHHEPTGDELVEHLIGIAVTDHVHQPDRWARPCDRIGRLRHRVVVQIDHRHQVRADPFEGELARQVAVFEAEDAVGHHDVVVHELPERLLAPGNAFLVGLDAALEVVDGLEVEGDGADAELARLLERGRVAAGNPDRRMPLAEGLR